MPELPEVERFRQILLPLVDKSTPLRLELVGEKLPRKWLSFEEAEAESGRWYCEDVVRKGKLLCMVLLPAAGGVGGSSDGTSGRKKKYLYLHMGMTGRLVSPTQSCSWGHEQSFFKEEPDTFSPRFTYLLLRSGPNRVVAFADPRKFGSCSFADDTAALAVLAPDALRDAVDATKLARQKRGVKALLLDQQRIVSGVGNWVADEVLYQTNLHPDQQQLHEEQAAALLATLREILTVAVDCLSHDVPYPNTWLFGYRWTKKKAGSKDHDGNTLTFLQSGGRTSAIVASRQKIVALGTGAAVQKGGKKGEQQQHQQQHKGKKCVRSVTTSTPTTNANKVIVKVKIETTTTDNMLTRKKGVLIAFLAHTISSKVVRRAIKMEKVVNPSIDDKPLTTKTKKRSRHVLKESTNLRRSRRLVGK